MNDDDEIDLDNLAMSMFPGINAQHREKMAALKRIERKVDQIMSKMDDFKVAQTAFLTAFSAWVDAANANQASSDKAVADAVAKYQAQEDVDMQALSDQLATFAAKVPAPPTPPPPVPVP